MSGKAASRQSLDLPGREQELMEKVVAAGKPVVLVLVNGRPLNITWASQHVPAILDSWYPGTQGGNAVARLLFGDVVPGGKLPFSWPRNVGQIPMNYAHNTTQAPEDQGKRYWDVESTPLYPFGFGLSYSRFAFSDLRLSKTKINPDESVDVTVVVQNTGARTGDEVAQLYLHQRYGSSSRPVRELKGFEQNRGETSRAKDVAIYNRQRRTHLLECGKPQLGGRCFDLRRMGGPGLVGVTACIIRGNPLILVWQWGYRGVRSDMRSRSNPGLTSCGHSESSPFDKLQGRLFGTDCNTP